MQINKVNRSIAAMEIMYTTIQVHLQMVAKAICFHVVHLASHGNLWSNEEI